VFDDYTPRLSLPYLAAGQAQKHVTVNEALGLLDALVQVAVESRTTAAQPLDPDDGEAWVLPAGRSGTEWALHPVGSLVRHDAGAWVRLPSPEGTLAYVRDEATFAVRKDGGWVALGAVIGELQNLTRLGIGTTADAENPLAAKIGKALLTARPVAEGGDGDLRVVLNKEAPADVLSLLLQSGWSGRAELGLVGSDDLTLKVSADGTAWATAFSVDRATGKASFPLSPNRRETAVFTASGSYTPPAWARRVRITAVGGGGGGGSGASGDATANRFGGGGGAAGGRTEEEFDVDELSFPLTVTVGAGGSGGVSATAANGVAGGTGGDTRVAVPGGTAVLYAAGGASGGGGSNTGGAGASGVASGHGASNGGGASSATATAGAGQTTAQSPGPGGGGAGGGIDTTGAQRAGGAGGSGYHQGYATGAGGRRATGGTGGGSGAAGTAGGDKSWTRGAGAGGGGGGAGTTGAPGGAGGAGGLPGGGGGGGGATRADQASGGGGAGGRGEVWITAWS